MNNLEIIHRNLLERVETSEEFPFGPRAAVYKVAGKMFALLSPDEFPPQMNLKCDPERAIDLRAEHEAVAPGYHMNKKHWNTILLDGSLPDSLIMKLIDHSFSLVVAGHNRATRERIQEAGNSRPDRGGETDSPSTRKEVD
ncbi:MAG: MmcQ/YjbR family DNA-binding protein [Verrucomicrobiales bacterium]|nr:MmcQ/YjbR family DNA-binding protein [Verrucomicrobiales bacterium]